MEVFELYALGYPVSRVGGKPGWRFALSRPVTVKDRLTDKLVEVNEFEADSTGSYVIHLYVGRDTEALNPDDFEVVPPETKVE